MTVSVTVSKTCCAFRTVEAHPGDTVFEIIRKNEITDNKAANSVILVMKIHVTDNGFGGLEVACWPLVPMFAGSNPAEAVGFFRAKKSSARLPSEGKSVCLMS